MSRSSPCASCRRPLEPVQEFRFLVESRPRPLCKACQAKPAARSGVLTAAGVLGVGWLVVSILAPRAA